MKSPGLGLLHLTLIAALAAGCGKDNESGKKSNNQWGYGNPYLNGGFNPVQVNSPYSYSGMTVNQVIQQNPCLSGFGGLPAYANQTYGGQRFPITVPLTNFPTVIPPNEIYVGVTSFGDVAVVAGQAVGQPPLFVGYMCPRSFAQQGQGQLLGVRIGAYSNCLFKPITAATVILPGGAAAEFRMMDYGSSARTKFSFCR
jgi:hypothetical protein